MSVKTERTEEPQEIEEHWEPIMKLEQPSTDTDMGNMRGQQVMPKTSVKKEVELEEWGWDPGSGMTAEAEIHSGHIQSPNETFFEKEIVWRFAEDCYNTCDPLSIEDNEPDEFPPDVSTIIKKEEEAEERDSGTGVETASYLAPDVITIEEEEERDSGIEAEGGGQQSEEMWRPEAPPAALGPSAPPPVCSPPRGSEAPPLAEPTPAGYATPPAADPPPGSCAAPAREQLYHCSPCERSFTGPTYLLHQCRGVSGNCSVPDMEQPIPSGLLLDLLLDSHNIPPASGKSADVGSSAPELPSPPPPGQPPAEQAALLSDFTRASGNELQYDHSETKVRKTTPLHCGPEDSPAVDFTTRPPDDLASSLTEKNLPPNRCPAQTPAEPLPEDVASPQQRVPRERSHHCVTCDKWFTSESFLRRHYKTLGHQRVLVEKEQLSVTGNTAPASLSPAHTGEPQPQDSGGAAPPPQGDSGGSPPVNDSWPQQQNEVTEVKALKMSPPQCTSEDPPVGDYTDPPPDGYREPPMAYSPPPPAYSVPGSYRGPPPAYSPPGGYRALPPPYSAPAGYRAPLPVYPPPVVYRAPPPVYSPPGGYRAPPPVFSAPGIYRAPSPAYSAPDSYGTPSPVYAPAGGYGAPPPEYSPPGGFGPPAPTTSAPEGGAGPRTASKLRPYKCTMCAQRFLRVEYLRRHYKTKRHKCILAEQTGQPYEPSCKKSRQSGPTSYGALPTSEDIVSSSDTAGVDGGKPADFGRHAPPPLQPPPAAPVLWGPPPMLPDIWNPCRAQVFSSTPQLLGVGGPTWGDSGPSTYAVQPSLPYSDRWQCGALPRRVKARLCHVPIGHPEPECDLSFQTRQGAPQIQRRSWQHVEEEERQDLDLQRRLACDRQSRYSLQSPPAPATSDCGSTVRVTGYGSGRDDTTEKSLPPFCGGATYGNSRPEGPKNTVETVSKDNSRGSGSRPHQCPPAPAPALPQSVPSAAVFHGNKDVGKRRPRCPNVTVGSSESLPPLRETHRTTTAGVSSELTRVCPICGGAFPREYCLREHVRLFHPGREYFECGHCGLAFAALGAYRTHSVEHAARDAARRLAEGYPKGSVGEKRPAAPEGLNLCKGPFRCDRCPKHFRRKEVLNRHQLLHLGVKAHACHICDRRFARRDAMVAHVKRHKRNRNIPSAIRHNCVGFMK